MPLSQEDLQVLTALVTLPVTAVMTAQATATPTTTAASSQANTNDKVDERHFRKMNNFSGTNWKDWAFQFRSATRSSNIEAHRLLEWAEKQTMEIAEFTEYDGEEEVAEKLSGQLFNLISTMVNGEPLQLMHNCGYNGAEAWRRLAKRYSPSSPMRMMQLMMQVVAPEKAKSVKDLPNMIERWEARTLMLAKDFNETVSSKMKAAILISFLPAELRDALIQQADKLIEYIPTKEKVMAIVEAKMAMRSLDVMEVDEVTWWSQNSGRADSIATGAAVRGMWPRSAPPRSP